MCSKPILRGVFCLLCLIISTSNGLAQSGTITIRTVAGNGSQGFSGDGGPANSAQFYGPFGIAVDAAGNLFIADHSESFDNTNSHVRKVTPGGLISSIVGNGVWGFSGDGGPATSAQFTYPGGLAVDAAGNLFLSDTGNHRIRKVTPAGLIRTVAGNGPSSGFLGGFGGDGGPATAAQLNNPAGVAVDAAGNLFFADSGNHRVRKVTAGGVISTVAGNGISGFSGDGGAATSAQLDYPGGLAVDAVGNLYIADYYNSRVRKVTPDGVIGTVAGNGTVGFGGDGGPATSAQLFNPIDVAVDSTGNLFIADETNHRIRKVTADGLIRTVVGDGLSYRGGFGGDGGSATSAQLSYPAGIAVDAAGNLFIADSENNRVRKVGNTPARTDEPAGLRRDFNGDGRGDILWKDAAGDVSTWLMNGYTITDNSFVANVLPGWTIAGSGDFNGDGKADNLWRDVSGNVSTWLMNGSTITSYSNTENMPTDWAVVGVADFDADGKADILWRDVSGNVLVWLMNGHRIANYSFVARIWPDWRIVGAADFNGDGKADILWRNTAGDVTIWLMDGTTLSSYSNTVFNTSKSWTVAGVADFDGDGRADLLWRDTSGNVGMWLMNGHTFSESFIANIWSGWAIVGTGDFNGDRRADILWRDTEGTVSIWLMNGATISGYNLVGNVSDRMAQ